MILKKIPILCLVIALLFSHCKKAEVESIEISGSVRQSNAQISSVLGYWKDNTTSVTTIDATPGYTKVVVYSVGPMHVSAGDVVSVEQL